MTHSADGSSRFSQVTIPELIQKNRTMVERVLRWIKGKLEAAEMEHRKQFKQEKLTDLFPETLHHYSAKVLEGTGAPSGAHGQFAKPHVQMVADVVRRFREALKKRGSLTSYQEALTEVEYPLGELQKYFDGTGSLQDASAARIFVYFVRDRIDRLSQIAAALDKEYQQNFDTRPSSDDAAG